MELTSEKIDRIQKAASKHRWGVEFVKANVFILFKEKKNGDKISVPVTRVSSSRWNVKYPSSPDIPKVSGYSNVIVSQNNMKDCNRGTLLRSLTLTLQDAGVYRYLNNKLFYGINIRNKNSNKRLLREEFRNIHKTEAPDNSAVMKHYGVK